MSSDERAAHPSGASAMGPLPFTMKDVVRAVPEPWRRPVAWKSFAYLALDLACIAGLLGFAATIYRSGAWYLWPLYWVAQGTMFWALFLIAHDTGHGSFSRRRWINDLVGYLCHTPLLVPYDAWRISHRKHHQNTGHVRDDESHVPMVQKQYGRLPPAFRWYRRFLSYTAVSFPFYLLLNNFGRRPQSHFNPYAPMFHASERKLVWRSTAAVVCFVALLSFLGHTFGWRGLLLFYAGPYVVFSQWFIIVTFLHHTETSVPWYHEGDWSWLRGSLSTVDRSYGPVLDFLHHNIGLHVPHHLLPSVPHYHLRQVARAIRPVLGDHYRTSNEPIIKAYYRIVGRADVVGDGPGPVFFRRAGADE